MQVRVDEAIAVYEKYRDLHVPMIFLHDLRFSVPDSGPKIIKHSSPFNSQIGKILRSAGVEEVELIFNERMVAFLANLFPARYRQPFGQLTFFELDKILTAFREMNKKSQRQRGIICVNEVYRREGNMLSVLIEYGEQIEYEKWNDIKTKIDKKQKFDYRYSENGIIVFVDLRPEGDNYLQRFYRNSDLVTSLVGRRREETIRIAPDFNRELDVYTVDDPGKLLDVYIAKNARLIIVGDTLSQEYKNALAKVKTYDRFARFMLATNIDQRNLSEFLSLVHKSYVSDNFSIDDFA